MTYTGLALAGVAAAVAVDLAVLRTRLLGRRAFWAAYAVVVAFQLLTNGLLTGTGTVRYDGGAIWGASSPADGPPPFLGDGRVAFAPVEDLLFGFALILLTQALWVFWGRRGVQPTPAAGPPRGPLARLLRSPAPGGRAPGPGGSRPEGGRDGS